MDIMGVYGKLRASAIQSDTLYQEGSLWCGRFIQQGSWIGVFDRTSRRYYQGGTAIPYKGSSSTNQVIRWECYDLSRDVSNRGYGRTAGKPARPYTLYARGTSKGPRRGTSEEGKSLDDRRLRDGQGQGKVLVTANV
ncbi:hypothetical protein GGX14DRAFT_383780 [Mycena pura]|uniref:Uncharacterized protein n=1 Tax=Mycena pura TaxID=153505 RepID=A0AAD7E5X8_9AGAR|nr:hypothetical protein GGX14DRAFT_383780 [Mycena pura]